MYAREVDGRELSFGVSGKLIRNVLVMYDRETESLWSQLIGEAVEGPLVGTKLEFLPSWMMTWEQWVAEHPETLALEKGYYGSRDPYENGYYDSASTGVIGETFTDERLYAKEFVLGVELAEQAVAYPFSVLNEAPVLNDVVGETAVLVFFEADSASGAVFGRTLADGRVLTFMGSDEAFVVVDEQTGSRWDMISGTVVAGELAGTALERVKSTAVFWFGWKDFHPDTILYGVEP